MLPAGSRLRRSQDFTRALRRGPGQVRVARPTLVVTLATDAAPPVGGQVGDAPAGQTLVGFAVSRAVGGAVVRNRVRRRLRHLVRSRLSLLPRGSLVVVRALPDAAKTPQRLEADLDAALHRAVARSGRALS